MPHILNEHRLKAKKMAQQISERKARRNRLIEVLDENGVSRAVLVKKSTSTEWMEEKARELGVQA